jgi:hypothetical protein
MSMPSIIFKCSECAHTGSTTVIWGDFSYIDGTQDFPLERCIGWCHGCDAFAPIEDFSDEEQLICRLADLTEEVTSIRKKPVLFFLTGSAKHRRDRLLEELSVISHRLRLIRDREGAEKCLYCGSSSVKAFDGRCGTYDEIPNEQPTGFMHPGCGGEFIASRNPMRLSLVFSPNYYSVEGERIISES